MLPGDEKTSVNSAHSLCNKTAIKVHFGTWHLNNMTITTPINM